MRIERIRIGGFGPLADVDLGWPEGRLLLVVDRNESGKTTLCEAIVVALYGLPRGRGAGGKLRELRRPRSGAPLNVGLDLVAEGRRWSVDRDLDAGTLRIVDRDRGVDATRDFLRASGRDGFGEAVTGGLPEALFRVTAYVAQNVLDRDTLDSSLTVELARIADAGGGEASVVKALKLIEAARKEMPEATTGPTVSVETEIVRLSRKLETLRAERMRLQGCRSAAAEASSRLSRLTRRRDAARERAEAAGVAVIEAERRSLERRLAELSAARESLSTAEAEAASLADDAGRFSRTRLAAIDRLREERGVRPETLRAAREEVALVEARNAEARRERERRLGAAGALPAGERERARRLLEGALDARAEGAASETAVEEVWEELRRIGVAEDLQRLEALPAEEGAFVSSAEEERGTLEIEGVRLDRKLADSQTQISILMGERHERVSRGRLLLAAAAALLPFAVWFALSRVSAPLAAGVGALALALGLFGAFGWLGGRQHGREDEGRIREEDTAFRRDAAEARRRLSDLRQRLDRVARTAGFADGMALLRAQRRLRAAAEAHRRLLERIARRDGAQARETQIAADLEPFRGMFGLAPGPPGAEAARRALAVLRDLEEALDEERTLAAWVARETERLEREASEIARIASALRDELAAAGVPPSLPLAEALFAAEVGRRHAARHAELLNVEIPARREAVDEAERARLSERLTALDAELDRRRERGRDEAAPGEVPEPETARRAAEDARAALEAAEADRLAGERELAAAAREGGEKARDVEEELAETEALLSRAALFRDALDLAQQALGEAAASVYGDFRRGLAEASRAILVSWGLPYDALEFGDDLSVSAVARNGRVATKAEIDAALSTGAREQLHLTARLAVLKYLGTGTAGVPLLLDDPLTGTDDERFVAVMGFLATHVLSERPVLLVSCHGWRHERLLADLPSEARDRLALVSLSGNTAAPRPGES